MAPMNTGILLAITTYVIWGLFPIYFHWLASIAPLRVVAARIVSSFILLLVLGWVFPGPRRTPRSGFHARTVLIYSIAALLISSNWLVFIWAVQHHAIIETSLGYFMNPLLSVLMGVLWFKESLRKGQWIAIALAGLGVLYLTWVYGRPPWIALILAISFALYGLVKKQAPLDPTRGLTLETGLLFIPALWYLAVSPGVPLGDLSPSLQALLVASGIVTAVPLWMFANAAQRIPLALLGMFQYITPIMQFLVGVALYREPFSRTDGIGFGMIWLALALFMAESLLWTRAQSITKRDSPGCV